jgi:LPXTG-motif cell wall-anchored protein
MDFLPSFTTSWWFLILMAVLLAALIGVLLFLRNKRPED